MADILEKMLREDAISEPLQLVIRNNDPYFEKDGCLHSYALRINEILKRPDLIPEDVDLARIFDGMIEARNIETRLHPLNFLIYADQSGGSGGTSFSIGSSPVYAEFRMRKPIARELLDELKQDPRRYI